MRPNFLTGDLVVKRGRNEKQVCVVVSVQNANNKYEHLRDVNQYVYYVFQSGGVTGPWFSTELCNV